MDANDDASSTSSEVDERRCARNLPWQKIFHKRIAPVCLAVIEEREKRGNDQGVFAAFGPPRGEVKRIIRIGDESILVQVVRDPKKPPPDLKYDQVTLVIEDPDADLHPPTKVSSDGIYLVREIASFSLAPNKGCINERLFMDRKRENYKSKGWGMGRWRVWLALEDIDAARKKRKKAEIAMLSGSKKKFDLVTPPADSMKRTLYDAIDVDEKAGNKRGKQATEPSLMNVVLNSSPPSSLANVTMPIAVQPSPFLNNPQLMTLSQQSLMAPQNVQQLYQFSPTTKLVVPQIQFLPNPQVRQSMQVPVGFQMPSLPNLQAWHPSASMQTGLGINLSSPAFFPLHGGLMPPAPLPRSLQSTQSSPPGLLQNRLNG